MALWIENHSNSVVYLIVFHFWFPMPTAYFCDASRLDVGRGIYVQTCNCPSKVYVLPGNAIDDDRFRVLRKMLVLVYSIKLAFLLFSGFSFGVGSSLASDWLVEPFLNFLVDNIVKDAMDEAEQELLPDWVKEWLRKEKTELRERVREILKHNPPNAANTKFQKVWVWNTAGLVSERKMWIQNDAANGVVPVKGAFWDHQWYWQERLPKQGEEA
jgi:hypothetical protein